MIEKRIKIIGLFILMINFGCGSQGAKTPDGILTKEQMIPIMVDTQIAEAALSVKNIHGDSAKQYAADYYNFIYIRHKVKKEVFEKSLDYYIQHPKELDAIYSEVITELSKKEAEEAK